MEEQGAQGGPSAPSIVRAHPHPAFFGGAVGYTLFVTLVVVLLIVHNDLPPATEWRIVVYGIAVALLGWVGPLLRWQMAWVDLDERRLRWSVGIVRRHRLESDLDCLQALDVEQGTVGRWLGYGALRAVDEAGVEHAFPPVGHVAAFRAAAMRSLGGRRDRAGSRKGRPARSPDRV
jgi:membrane protein YdbS with pleckstrin-like domain